MCRSCGKPAVETTRQENSLLRWRPWLALSDEHRTALDRRPLQTQQYSKQSWKLRKSSENTLVLSKMMGIQYFLFWYMYLMYSVNVFSSERIAVALLRDRNIPVSKKLYPKAAAVKYLGRRFVSMYACCMPAWFRLYVVLLSCRNRCRRFCRIYPDHRLDADRPISHETFTAVSIPGQSLPNNLLWEVLAPALQEVIALSRVLIRPQHCRLQLP